MFAIIDRLMGLFGTIPPGWKQRIYSLLLAAIPVIEIFVDVPDAWETEKFLGQVALGIAVVISFILKLVRDRVAPEAGR